MRRLKRTNTLTNEEAVRELLVKVQPFCADPDEGGRYHLDKPFVNGDRLYAADERICIRTQICQDIDFKVETSRDAPPVPGLFERLDERRKKHKDLIREVPVPDPIRDFERKKCSMCEGCGRVSRAGPDIPLEAGSVSMRCPDCNGCGTNRYELREFAHLSGSAIQLYYARILWEAEVKTLYYFADFISPFFFFGGVSKFRLTGILMPAVGESYPGTIGRKAMDFSKKHCWLHKNGV